MKKDMVHNKMLQDRPLHEEIINLDSFLHSLKKSDIQKVGKFFFPEEEISIHKKKDLIDFLVQKIYIQFPVSQIKKKTQQIRTTLSETQSQTSLFESLRSKKQSQIQRKKVSTINFLNYMKKNMGNLNSYMKCAYKIGNVCGRRKFITSEENRMCALATQCFITSQTIHYMFSNESSPIHSFTPNREFIQNWKDHLLPGMVANISITIASTIDGFLGHFANIVVIKELNGRTRGFLIQSFLNKYTIDWKSISMEEIENILLDYGDLFFFPSKRLFQHSEQNIWNQLTAIPKFQTEEGTSLLGTPKPIYNAMSYTTMYIPDLGNYLKNRYQKLIRKCMENINAHSCNLQETFGPFISQQEIKSVLERELTQNF